MSDVADVDVSMTAQETEVAVVAEKKTEKKVAKKAKTQYSYDGFSEDVLKRVKACVASLRTNSKKAGCTPAEVDQKVQEYLAKKLAKGVKAKVDREKSAKKPVTAKTSSKAKKPVAGKTGSKSKKPVAGKATKAKNKKR
jgi:hypothetical protein